MAPMSTPLFEAAELVKRYGENTVVDGVSFAIHPGECLGVIGPNGAGKTTTIRMCLGLTAPDGGIVIYASLALVITVVALIASKMGSDPNS